MLPVRSALGNTNSTRRWSVWPRMNQATSAMSDWIVSPAHVRPDERLAAAAGGEHQDVVEVADRRVCRAGIAVYGESVRSWIRRVAVAIAGPSMYSK